MHHFSIFMLCIWSKPWEYMYSDTNTSHVEQRVKLKTLSLNIDDKMSRGYTEANTFEVVIILSLLAYL